MLLPQCWGLAAGMESSAQSDWLLLLSCSCLGLHACSCKEPGSSTEQLSPYSLMQWKNVFHAWSLTWQPARTKVLPFNLNFLPLIIVLYQYS